MPPCQKCKAGLILTKSEKSQRKSGLHAKHRLHEVHYVGILFKSDAKHVKILNKVTLTVTGESTR